MTVFNLLDKNREELLVLKRNGIISSSVFKDMSMYREFKSMAGDKMDRYDVLVERYKLSNKQVRRIINKLAKIAK